MSAESTGAFLITGIHELSHESEVELVLKARAGDERALATLLLRYRGLAASFAKRFYLPRAGIEDLHQEAMVGFLGAIRNYDPASGSPFSAFVRMCIRRQVFTALKVANRLKHHPINSSVSLDVVVVNDKGEEHPLAEMVGPTTQDPAGETISTLGAIELRGFLSEQLTWMEKGVLDLYIDGKSYEEIASHVGVSLKGVDNALQRVKRKVRTFIASPKYAG